ncbi:hypothetical protein CPC08DRAFT_726304 [Agrocybe pediades]|nr:hypothetical protein CPC08DRAFT_726304 [Agrocybe pediades]
MTTGDHTQTFYWAYWDAEQNFRDAYPLRRTVNGASKTMVKRRSTTVGHSQRRTPSYGSVKRVCRGIRQSPKTYKFLLCFRLSIIRISNIYSGSKQPWEKKGLGSAYLLVICIPPWVLLFLRLFRSSGKSTGVIILRHKTYGFGGGNLRVVDGSSPMAPPASLSSSSRLRFGHKAKSQGLSANLWALGLTNVSAPIWPIPETPAKLQRNKNSSENHRLADMTPPSPQRNKAAGRVIIRGLQDKRKHSTPATDVDRRQTRTFYPGINPPPTTRNPDASFLPSTTQRVGSRLDTPLMTAPKLREPPEPRQPAIQRLCYARVFILTIFASVDVILGTKPNLPDWEIKRWKFEIARAAWVRVPTGPSGLCPAGSQRKKKESWKPFYYLPQHVNRLTLPSIPPVGSLMPPMEMHPLYRIRASRVD